MDLIEFGNKVYVFFLRDLEMVDVFCFSLEIRR